MKFLFFALVMGAFAASTVLAAGMQVFDVKAGQSPQGRFFPKMPSPAKSLLHVDLLKATFEERFALTVLQGIVNRSQPRICITQDPAWHGTHNMPKWIEGLKGRGYSFEEVADPLSLVSRFRDEIEGAVIVEAGLKGNELHKLNAVTLYCSIYDCIPLTEELNRRLNLPVLLDVRGKYMDADSAYEWAYRDLWPHANKRMLAWAVPSHVVLRDYLVAHKIMPVWNSKGMSGSAQETIFRFLDDAAPNAAVLGCWGGYGEDPPGRTTEPELQRLSSLRGKWLIVTDGCFNLTVHSALTYKKPASRPAPAIKLDRSKVYLTYAVTDGDNLQYIQQAFRGSQWWDDPNRGKVPIGWSMNPLASELIPDVLEFFQTTASSADEFFCATAGIGLVTPSLYGKDRYVNHESVYKEFVKMTSRAMKTVGFDIVHLGDTSMVPWTRGDYDYWSRHIGGLKGILGDYGQSIGVNASNSTFFTENGVGVVRTVTAPGNHGPNERSARELADAIKAAASGRHRPMFMHVALINWFYSPTVVYEATKLLGDEFVPVLPSQLIELMKQAKTPKN